MPGGLADGNILLSFRNISTGHRQLVAAGQLNSRCGQGRKEFIAKPHCKLRPKSGIFGSCKLCARRQ
jgi:hypothetical protein